MTHSYQLGHWTVDLSAGRLVSASDETERLEPKVADLLRILIDASGEVVSRDVLFGTIWPDVTVGEDTLTRLIFKLRRALGDDPKAPSFVETVPKRGYRLMVPAQPVEEDAPATNDRWKTFIPWASAAAAMVLILALIVLIAPGRDGETTALDIKRANDRYMLFTRADNEAAIDLYRRALSQPSPDPEAEAGLAAALVQRVIRWPEVLGSDREGATSLEAALSVGLTETPEAQATLDRARTLAERSVRRRPNDANAWRIVGLVRTAQGDIDGAFDAYDRALRYDPDNWAVQINLAELFDMKGDPARAYSTLTQAYEGMEEAYAAEPQRIAPWRAPLGVIIAERDLHAERIDDAEAWYRRVLRDEPLNEQATLGYAELLLVTGRNVEMHNLCADYQQRTGEVINCPS